VVNRPGYFALFGRSVQRVTVLAADSHRSGHNHFQRRARHIHWDYYRRDLLVAECRKHRFIALIVAIVLGFYKERLSSLGFTTNKLPKALLYGVVGFIVAFILAGIVGYPIQQNFGVDPTQEALSVSAAVPNLLPIVFLSGVIIAPIAEEVVFRGYLYKAFRDRFKPSYAIVLSAALFSVIHLELLAAAPLFVIGVVLAYVYEKTGNLMAPITLHVLNNAVAFLFVR